MNAEATPGADGRETTPLRTLTAITSGVGASAALSAPLRINGSLVENARLTLCLLALLLPFVPHGVRIAKNEHA